MRQKQYLLAMGLACYKWLQTSFKKFEGEARKENLREKPEREKVQRRVSKTLREKPKRESPENLKEKPKRESPKRTISASGGLGLLQMVAVGLDCYKW